jgi:hypothetical protein
VESGIVDVSEPLVAQEAHVEIMRNNLVPFGALLALGLIGSTVVASGTVKDIKNSGDISVKGFAERKITSDLGVWRGSFSVRGGDLVSTYESLRKQTATVKDWLKKQGVSEAQIELGATQTEVLNKRTPEGNYTNEIEAYVLTQSVEVEGGDIALIARIARDSTSLIKDGVAFHSGQPLWFYTKLNDLKIELLGEAAKDARVRAEKIAEHGDSDVGALIGADQGVFQITSPTTTEVSGYGELDTSSIHKSVKAVVTARYAVD